MPIVRSYHDGQPEYAVIQQSVAAHFFQHHKARPQPRPDEFWSLLGPSRSLPGLASLGLCWGDRGPLFSEHYLPGRRICGHQDRSALVEIGQVASFEPGSGSRLLDLTISELAQRNLRHVLMTATAHIRSIVNALGIPATELGVAELRHCRDAHLDWGTYYQNDPRVILLDLQPLAQALRTDADRRRMALDRSFGPPHGAGILSHPINPPPGVSHVVAA
ncbi:thermostable hemolysin [Xaviernesmea oryzae]|uniref:thermostable hemolysin n=1 Tax=Xaviernesmea oryzae TaxID=464029 RepID=UPI0008B4490F|nr:thermostable hemolysin [Xaviernesmea oryzae]SEM00834.1 Thermostable hemolysin [Xaviernesmea oryzae]